MSKILNPKSALQVSITIMLLAFSCTIHGQSISDNKAAVKPMVRIVAGYSDNLLSFDPFVIYSDTNATFNFDSKYDALKLINSDPAVTSFFVYGYDNSKLSINGIPFDGKSSMCQIQLGLKTRRAGTVEIKIKDIAGMFTEQSIILTDKITGATYNLSTGTSYSVYLTEGDYNDRFFLSIGSIVTNADRDIVSENLLKTYTRSGVLVNEIELQGSQNGILTVVNLSGQTIYSAKIYESGTYEVSDPVPSGILIATLTTGTSRKSNKVFLSR